MGVAMGCEQTEPVTTAGTGSVSPLKCKSCDSFSPQVSKTSDVAVDTSDVLSVPASPTSLPATPLVARKPTSESASPADPAPQRKLTPESPGKATDGKAADVTTASAPTSKSPSVSTTNGYMPPGKVTIDTETESVIDIEGSNPDDQGETSDPESFMHSPSDCSTRFRASATIRADRDASVIDSGRISPDVNSRVGDDAVSDDGAESSPRSPSRPRMMRKSITQQTAQVVSTALQCIIENPGVIDEFYTFKKQVLGKGTYGSVKVAVVNASGAKRAVKTIPIKDMHKNDTNEQKNIAREIKILKLIDHLHIVKLYETFENDDNLFLVMALSSYGHLAKYVQGAGHLSQIATRQAMRNLISAVNYLHNNLIVHRDIKPKNVLVHTVTPLSLRLTDFGLARTFQPMQVFSSPVGSPTFMAPEVYREKYTQACDVWSSGVTMYFMLAGYLPFTGESTDEIKQKILTAEPKYETVEWVEVGQNTLAFLELMLKKNPRARYTADQTFHHEWLKSAQKMTGPVEITADMIGHLRTFRKGNKLKRSALTVIASMLKTEDVMHPHQIFTSIDVNGDGQISYSEMRNSMKSKMEASQVEQMFECDSADITEEDEESGSKPFTYSEFIAATFDRKRCITKAILKAAFSCYDKDGDGNISMAELAQGQLLGHLSMEEMAKTLEDLDSNGDCFIDRQEFLEMLLAD